MKSLNKEKRKNNIALEWDLEAILENKTLDDLFTSWKKSIDNLIEAYDNGKCYLKEQKFYKYLKLDLLNTKLFNRITNYVNNKLNENVINETFRLWEQKIFNASQKVDLVFANDYNIIFKYKKQIQQFLLLPKYKKYRRLFELIFKCKKNLLPKKIEILLTNVSNGMIDISSIYQILSTSEIKYKPAYNKNNKKFLIKNETDGYFLLKKLDRSLRKSAWLSLQEAYLSHKNTFSKLLYYNYLSLNLSSKISHFSNFIEAQCFADEIPVDFLMLIHQNIKKFSILYKKYNQINLHALKSKYNLKKIYPWDTELNLFNTNKYYSISQAKKIVLKTLNYLGPEYVECVKKIFSERWISWLPKANKQSGAYSVGGIYGLKKFYIFLNYNNTLESVFSLIHEIGHSIHSYYITQKQTIYCEVDTFSAEIASLVNEILLNFYLLDTHKNNLKMIANIYEKIISNFFDTTLFQILLSDFELQFVSNLDKRKLITSNEVIKMYGKAFLNCGLINQKRFDKLFKIKNPKFLTNIFKIDHFYSGSLYVYKYAIAQIVALNVAKKIFDGDKIILKKYLKFLEIGSSKSPLDAIKFLGINLYQEECWNNAFNYVNNLMNQYKKILIKFKL